eukprot:3566554-Pleurochrysis_carterae.AAC.7
MINTLICSTAFRVRFSEKTRAVEIRSCNAVASVDAICRFWSRKGVFCRASIGTVAQSLWLGLLRTCAHVICPCYLPRHALHPTRLAMLELFSIPDNQCLALKATLRPAISLPRVGFGKLNRQRCR